MLVSRLSIENFRGIKKAELHFSGHTLLIGGNNVGKSTVCEALDLVLGPDRLNRMSPVEEFDFYNATYLDTDGETVIPIRIEVVLVDLTDEVKTLCAANLELWHKNERRLLGEGEIESVDEGDVEFCLRLITLARYDIEEDQLVARTIYGRSGEGITEQEALLVSAQKMEENDAGLFQLDVAGICVVNADGVGNLEKLGAFFKEIGTPAFAVFDRNKRTPDQIATLKNVYEIAFEIQQTGAEALMAEETPLDRQWQYLEILRNEDGEGRLKIPSERPTDEVIRRLTQSTLKGLKGEGGAARLLELCAVDELPTTIRTFLTEIYQRYPKPKRKEIAVPQVDLALREEPVNHSANDEPRD